MNEEKSSGTITIQPIQPGWIVIHFKDGLPARQRRFDLLHKAVQKWLGMNLRCRLQDVQKTFNEHGELCGLNVFFSVEPQESKLAVTVDDEVARAYGSEYLEAVLSDAVNFLIAHPQGFDHVALVNRRHIAVILRRKIQAASVVPVERLEAHLPDETRSRLLHWLTQPGSKQYVIDLPDELMPWENRSTT